MISAFVAFAILGTSTLVFDQAHLFSAPAGTIEVGQLTLVQPLDAVIVVAKR